MFVQRLPENSGIEAVKAAAEMRAWAKSKGIKVIHALIDVDATPFETCKDAARFSAILEDIGDELTFTCRPGYVSALKSPGLEDFLQQNGIKSLLLCGFSTSACVARTAFSAGDAEYVVSIISDACADVDEELHKIMLEKVLKNRGYVATAKKVRSGFEEATGSD